MATALRIRTPPPDVVERYEVRRKAVRAARSNSLETTLVLIGAVCILDSFWVANDELFTAGWIFWLIAGIIRYAPKAGVGWSCESYASNESGAFAIEASDKFQEDV